MHYLAFPRGGPTTESAAAMRNIWCAEDRAQALTDAKINNEVVEAELSDCAKPVSIALETPVTDTPAFACRLLYLILCVVARFHIL